MANDWRQTYEQLKKRKKLVDGASSTSEIKQIDRNTQTNNISQLPNTSFSPTPSLLPNLINDSFSTKKISDSILGVNTTTNKTTNTEIAPVKTETKQPTETKTTETSKSDLLKRRKELEKQLTNYEREEKNKWWDSDDNLLENAGNVLYKLFAEKQDDKYVKDDKYDALVNEYNEVMKQIKAKTVEDESKDLNAFEKAGYTVMGNLETSAKGIESTALKILGQTPKNEELTFGEEMAQVSRQQTDGVGGVGLDVLGSVSRMIPQMAVGNPTGAIAMGFANYGGGAYNEAKRDGYSEENATMYGLAIGTMEMALSKALGTFSNIYGKSALGGKTQDILGGIIPKVISNKQVREVLTQSISEGGEEFLQEYIDNIAKDTLLDEKGFFKSTWENIKDPEVFKDALYSALVGGITGGAMATPGAVDSYKFEKASNVNEQNVVPTETPIETQEEANIKTINPEQEIQNIDSQIETLEQQLIATENDAEYERISNQIRVLENKANQLEQTTQQNNEIEPVQMASVEQTQQPTVQEVESNLPVEVESNIQNNTKNQLSEALVKEIQYKTSKANENKTDVKLVPTNEISVNENNGGYRNEEQISKLTEDIKQNGIVTPIELKIENGKVEVVNGNHRLSIAKELGLQEVPVKYVNYDMENIENSPEILYNSENENSLRYVEGEFESGNRNGSDINESNVGSEINEENSINNNVAVENKGTTGEYDKLPNKVQGDNDRPSSTTTSKQNTTPTQQELDNLEYTRKNKSGSEYASAFFDLGKKYGTTNLYKALNNYKTTGKALVEDIAPIKTELSDLTKDLKTTIKDTKKELKTLKTELNSVKEDISNVLEEYKALTEADLPNVEQQYKDNFRSISDEELDTMIAPVKEDTTPEYEYETSNEPVVETLDPFQNKDIDEVGKRSVKAYQYENPEVRPYFQTEALAMLGDLQNSVKGEKIWINEWNPATGLMEANKVTGTQRQTTDDIAYLLDNFNYTYKEIENGLNAIIEDHGKENIAVAKRIEFMLNDRLLHGYTSIDGTHIPANEDYINFVRDKQITEYNEEAYQNYINTLDGLEMPVDNDIAPVTENAAKNTLNQSLAIEPGPTDFDNGGPMLRVAPEMQKKKLSKSTSDKTINWDSIEDTSGGEQQYLFKNKLKSLENREQQVIADEQAEKFGVEAEEQNGADTISQILTEKPERVKGKWDNVNKLKKLGAIKLLQKDYYINKLARETSNQSLSEDSNNLRHANRISSQIAIDGIREWKVDRSKSRRKGRLSSTQKAQGIDQIYAPIENKGLTQQFDDYVYNLHNIDRMSIESKARDKMTKLKDTTLKGYSIQQIEQMAKGIDPNEQQLNFDLKFNENDIQKIVAASKEFVRLSKEHNKTVFGEQITAEVSKQNLAKYQEYKKTFDKQSEELTKLNDALLDFDVESGRMTAEEKAFIKERFPNYVPVYYAIDESKVQNGKRFIGRDIRIKEALDVAEGGSSEIIPLKDAMQIKVRQKVAQNLMNKLGLNIKQTLEKQGKLKVISSDSTDVMERYTKSNEQLLSEMQDGGYALTVFEDGNKITFEVPLEIYEALKPSDIPVVDTLNTLVDMKRSLLTEYNLYFAVRNIMRDMPTAFLQSQNSLRWTLNIPEAVRQVASKGQYYQLAQTLGAGNNDYANMNQKNFADIAPTNLNEIQKQQDYEGNKFKTGWEAFKNWKGVKWIADVNGFMEQIPRMAEFITSVDTSVQNDINPLTGGKYTYAQDEVTVNFGKGGDYTKFLDRNATNFMNASMQGTMKLVDTFRDAYAYKGAKGLANTMLKYSLAGASMIALMSWAWDDDEDYEELSDYVKNNYYILGKYGDGQFIRIPKGRTNAVIESLLGNGLGLMQGDISLQDAITDTFSVIENNIAPTTFSEANLFSTLKQVYTNTTWYGDDLVPTRLQDLPAEEQFDETTDSFSIWLGQQLGISPYKINYFINQSSGFLGDMILPSLTQQAETPIDNDLTEMFLGQFYKDFTTDSTMKNQNITDFYKVADELTVAAKGKDATDEDKLKNKYISEMSYRMSDLYAEKREIQSSKDLTDSEKIEALRETQKQINAIAEEGLNNYQNVNKTSNYAIIGDEEFYLTVDDEGKEQWYSPKEEELETLNSMGMGIEQKGNYFSTKGEISGIYDEYDVLLDNASSEDEKNELYSQRKLDIAAAVKGTNLNSDQKYYLYDKYYGSTDKINTMKAIGIDADSFIDYDSQTFTSDKNIYGETISGSKKTKVFDYINTMNLDFEQKVILAKLQYNSYDEYNYEIIDYLNNISYITYEEEVEILKQLGFEVDNDGNIYWD